MFYKHHGIRWLSVGQCYDSSLRNYAELLPQRQAYAQLLSNIILTRKGVVYIDETSFNCWDMPKKTWSNPNEKIVIARND